MIFVLYFSIYEKLIEFCGIDEKGTNYPPELYDPSIWGKESFYDCLGMLCWNFALLPDINPEELMKEYNCSNKFVQCLLKVVILILR